MYVLDQYEDANNHIPYCAALGSFDGVHLGHQQIINSMIKKSKELNAKSLVYTFNIHPKTVLDPNTITPLITSNEKRIDVLRSLDLNCLYLENFSNISTMTPENFIKDILVGIFKVKYLFVGYNYHFGHKSIGNSDKLVELGRKYGFGVDVFSPILINEQIVSSSLIRDLITSGQVEKVKDFLGRDYSIIGSVIYGKQIGKRIGVRTANINADKNFIIPRKGVYFTTSVINDKEYKSLTNIGINPTFKGSSLNIETHLLDFNKDIYGSNMEIFFSKRIRDEKTFESTEDLLNQINTDIKMRLIHE